MLLESLQIVVEASLPAVSFVAVQAPRQCIWRHVQDPRSNRDTAVVPIPRVLELFD